MDSEEKDVVFWIKTEAKAAVDCDCFETFRGLAAENHPRPTVSDGRFIVVLLTVS